MTQSSLASGSLGEISPITSLLKNRMFCVHIGDRVSRWRTQKNGLPQGSVLAPTLFNIYINDLPQTISRTFVYADDICCASQARTFKELELTMTADTSAISDYCAKWRLQSPTQCIKNGFKCVSPAQCFRFYRTHCLTGRKTNSARTPTTPCPEKRGQSILGITLTNLDTVS